MVIARLRGAGPGLLCAAILIVACVSLVLFGIIGIGRPGSGSFDMAFLYAAGRTWLGGLNAYVFAQRQASVGDFPFDIYAFAYPPPVFPLAVALGWFAFPTAKLLMLVFNTASVMGLSAYCVTVANPAPSAETAIHGAYTHAYRWIIPAVVIGNPFTAHVFWMGQTSLIVAAAIVWGCRFAQQGRPLLAGVLLAISTIKPQFSVFVLLWLATQRRWWPILVAGATSVLFSLGPLLISGPVATVRTWLQDIKVYQANPSNSIGFEHSFGLQSVLYDLGIAVPGVALIALAFVAVIFFARAKIVELDILPLLLGTALLFSVAHDYDLVVAAPLVPAMWRHLRHGGRSGAVIAFCVMGVMFLPQRFLRPFDNSALLQFRVLAFLGLVVWLFVLSAKDAAKKNHLAPAPQTF